MDQGKGEYKPLGKLQTKIIRMINGSVSPEHNPATAEHWQHFLNCKMVNPFFTYAL